MQRRWWKVIDSRRVAGARSTAWRIVLRPERRYQALRLRRTAARLRDLIAAHRPSFWHPCRSTAQWIAWNWLGRARDLPGIGGGGRSQFGHDLNLHIAVLQLPFIVLLEQYRLTLSPLGPGHRHLDVAAATRNRRAARATREGAPLNNTQSTDSADHTDRALPP